MREEVSIRGAVAADSQGVLDCLASAFEPFRDTYTPEAFRDTVLTAETIGRRLAEMSVYVAVDGGGRIIGTIGYQMIDGEEGHIRGMAVLQAHQGRGVARRLLEHVEEELRRRGCARISLDTTTPLKQAVCRSSSTSIN